MARGMKAAIGQTYYPLSGDMMYGELSGTDSEYYFRVCLVLVKTSEVEER